MNDAMANNIERSVYSRRKKKLSCPISDIRLKLA